MKWSPLGWNRYAYWAPSYGPLDKIKLFSSEEVIVLLFL